jgi:hypothetical protein
MHSFIIPPLPAMLQYAWYCCMMNPRSLDYQGANASHFNRGPSVHPRGEVIGLLNRGFDVGTGHTERAQLVGTRVLLTSYERHQ